MSKRTPRRSDEEWRQIILEARSCGGSDFEYCRSHGISYSTFYRALSRLRQHTGADEPCGSHGGQQNPANAEKLMLGDISSASHIYLATGYTDMRKSIDELMAIVRDAYSLDPYSNSGLQIRHAEIFPLPRLLLPRSLFRTLLEFVHPLLLSFRLQQPDELLPAA